MKPSTILVSALLLAGCGQQGGNNSQTANAAGDGSAAPTATSGLIMQPGQWETTMLMAAPAAADLPPGVTLPPARPIVSNTCITPEEVKDADSFFHRGGTRHGVECDYSGVTIAGGRIHGVSVCRSQGIELSMTMDGSFTPTAYDINQQIRSTRNGQIRESASHMSGRRIGDCPAGADGASGNSH